jgi:hypothetical protein
VVHDPAWFDPVVPFMAMGRRGVERGSLDPRDDQGV